MCQFSRQQDPPRPFSFAFVLLSPFIFAPSPHPRSPPSPFPPSSVYSQMPPLCFRSPSPPPPSSSFPLPSPSPSSPSSPPSSPSFSYLPLLLSLLPLFLLRIPLPPSRTSSSSPASPPPLPSVPSSLNTTMGLQVLMACKFWTDEHWVWVSGLVGAAFTVLCNVLTVLMLKYLNHKHPWSKAQPAISQHQIDGREAALTGGHSDYTEAPIGLSGGEEFTQHGMVLPFHPLILSFHNVNYFVDMPSKLKYKSTPPGQRLQLLHNVSGVFRPGVLTALMGVSGAGKTTLMDVLEGRKTGGYIEGDIRVSGNPKVQETFLRVSGYCEQEDIHTPQVTVYESLLYSAWLRLPQEIARHVVMEFVEEVMGLVELEAVRGALMGTAGRDGLPVEQRKRLTMAVELVANPSIIFLDEPTSGLDARAAAIVMRAVRNTVNTGRAVVCTIHQPSIHIFEAFDESIPGVQPIQPGANPAAWMLEVKTPAAAGMLGADFSQLFRQSETVQSSPVSITPLIHRTMNSLNQQSSVPLNGEADLFFPTQHPTMQLSQFATHLWKRHLMYWRMPDYNGACLFFSFVMSLFIGAVFFGFGKAREIPPDIVNVMGALYTAALFLGSIPYALAQGMIELPYLVLQEVVYSLLTYSMIQFEWTLSKFMLYLRFQFLTLLYFTCFGIMASAISAAEGLAVLLSAFIYSLWNLLCGFLLPQPLGDVTTLVVSPPGMPAQTVSQFIQLYYRFFHDWLGYATAILLGFSALFFCVFIYALRNLNFQRR
ncbi:unnamed protein product [Closterium sp. NIES-64]|nr:unnamed protein product [Closterium sp. NIES-64]